ncbi:hypothetical protein B0H13DRAFT_1085460 [Mycena leptocephala]|nr:hypothetical protein B0H13DRAFT_1085460 [Mycena leptocephala]
MMMVDHYVTSRHSFLLEPTAEEGFDIKWSSALRSLSDRLRVGGERVFSLAMALYPAVQAKVQREIDAMVAGERLSTFCGPRGLAVLRCHSVVPTCVPHRATRDDVYDSEGHFILKGALVLTNIHRITHDAPTYATPTQ